MADLLGSESDATADGDPRVVGLDSEDADDLMDALSSETARSVLAALQDAPANPSEVADRVDTSLQNAQYHLDSLEDAGVVKVVDTAYSQKGREMDVYAPANEPLVVFAGSEEEAGTIRRLLGRLLGGLAVVGLASVVVQVLLGGRESGGGGVGVMDATPEPTGLPPGALFFAGGAVVLLAVFAVSYARSR